MKLHVKKKIKDAKESLRLFSVCCEIAKDDMNNVVNTYIKRLKKPEKGFTVRSLSK